jgi:hypothetical protein
MSVRISLQKYAEVVHMLRSFSNMACQYARNKTGLTPFVLAFQRGLAEIIHVLVQYGDSGAHHGDNDNAN